MILYSLHKYAGILAVCLAAALFTSCDKYTSHVDDLVAALPDAWDDCDDALENYSVDILKEIEADPDKLVSGTQADYIQFGHLFNLTQPIDHTARAIGSAIFGEFADLAYAVNDASIDNKTKKAATQFINEKFNQNWALLFGAICALDGGFELSYERDSFTDKDFDYEPSELVKILKEQGYLSGGFSIGGMPLPSSSDYDTSAVEVDTPIEVEAAYEVVEGDPPIEEDMAKYSGTIAGKEVSMQLFYDDGEVTGWYRYAGNDGQLDLTGTYDGEFLTLEESYNGKKTGDLRIQVYHNSTPVRLSGTITNYKGNTYDVELSRIN